MAGNGRCFTCFQNKHLASACKSNYKCHKCNGRHHISICTFSRQRTNNYPVNQGDGTPLVQPQLTPTPVPPQPQQPPTSLTTNFSSNKNNVLLQMATANVSNLTSNPISEDVQIVFDSGSQRTYVSDSLRKRLKLQTIRTERIVINTFGNDEIRAQDTDIVLMKLFTDSKIFFVEAICSPIICTDLASQNQNFASKEYEHLKNLNLADKSGEGNKLVEILIGLDYYYQFITGEIIKGKVNESVALESCFGWI